jgi:hypothetical protein
VGPSISEGRLCTDVFGDGGIAGGEHPNLMIVRRGGDSLGVTPLSGTA